MAWANSNNNGGGNEDFRSWNRVEKWALRCFEMKPGNGDSVMMRCAMSGMKMKGKDGQPIMENGKPKYAKGMNVWVYCNPETCEVEQMNYEGQDILVDGSFAISEYTSKDGVTYPDYRIFASKIVLRPSR